MLHLKYYQALTYSSHMAFRKEIICCFDRFAKARKVFVTEYQSRQDLEQFAGQHRADTHFACMLHICYANVIKLLITSWGQALHNQDGHKVQCWQC